MQLKVIVHSVPPDEGSGIAAEVPALPGCAIWGATRDELRGNVREAIVAWLDVPVQSDESGEVIELAV